MGELNIGELNDSSPDKKAEPETATQNVATGLEWPLLVDWSKVLSLVFGGCCTYV